MKNYWALIKLAVAVNSSHIADVAYNEADQTLIVTWKNGRRYEYTNVPKNLYEEFLSAPSQGKFFNENIRNNYEFQEIM
jgi:hypothetical protein